MPGQGWLSVPLQGLAISTPLRSTGAAEMPRGSASISWLGSKAARVSRRVRTVSSLVSFSHFIRLACVKRTVWRPVAAMRIFGSSAGLASNGQEVETLHSPPRSATSRRKRHHGEFNRGTTRSRNPRLAVLLDERFARPTDTAVTAGWRARHNVCASRLITEAVHERRSRGMRRTE